MKIRVHVIVGGKVQGVYFRALTKRKADSLNVKGFVRNLPSDGVEAVFEGEENDVEALVEFCHKGPANAVVKSVNVIGEKFIGKFFGFEIKY
jgi:acylphosphatase